MLKRVIGSLKIIKTKEVVTMNNANQNQFEELKKLASNLEPKWKPVTISQATTFDKEKARGGQKIRAQCCKPGPCSPKW